MGLIHTRLMNVSSKQNSFFFKSFIWSKIKQCQFFRHVLKVSMFNASLIFMFCKYRVGGEYDGRGAVSAPRLACEGQMTTFSN